MTAVARTDQAAVREIGIPAFVVRGAACWDDTFELVSWRNEADLRDALATAWWMHGADVRTEVRVPDCGRIDILVSVGVCQLIIEVKRKITNSSEARQAFQQAHAYRAYLDSADENLDAFGDLVAYRTAHVVASSFDEDAAAPAARAYQDVEGHRYGVALVFPETHFPDDATTMAAIARQRHDLLCSLVQFSRKAEIAVGHAVESRALAEVGFLPCPDP